MRSIVRGGGVLLEGRFGGKTRSCALGKREDVAINVVKGTSALEGGEEVVELFLVV